MTIEYVADGARLTDLERAHPGLTKALPPKAVRTGGRVRFVGTVRTRDGRLFMFLPKGGWRADREIAARIAVVTMGAIHAYLRAMRREGRSPVGVGGELLELVAELTDDFLQNGILDQRENQTTREVGRPDWTETFARDTPFRDGRGRTSFTSIRTETVRANTAAEISELHVAVMDDIIRDHGWWLGVRAEILDSPAASIPHVDECRARLEKAKATSWSARGRRTIELLDSYLHRESGHVDGIHATGLPDFSAVWEWMLARVLVGNDRGIVRSLPRTAIRKRDGTVEIVGDSRPDIVLKEGSRITLVDAKYYAATGAYDMPGGGDIRKQQDYLRALRSVLGNDVSISNHFAFPSEQTGRGEIGEIFHIDQDGGVSEHSPPILCDYLSVEDVMTALVQGRKIGYPARSA